MSYEDEIQNLRRYVEGDEFDLIAAQIEGMGRVEIISAAKALTVRFTLDSYASIVALAELAGDAPKNAIVNQLVHAAAAQTFQKLGEAKREEFMRRHSEILHALCTEAGVEFEQINEQSGAVQ